MSSPSFFDKLKLSLKKKPTDQKPADSSLDSSTVSTKSQKSTEEKFEPKTKEKILQTTLGTDKIAHFHQAIEEAIQQNLEGRDLSLYFKDSAETLSERFFTHFSKPEEIDVTSQEVLDLTSTPQGPQQEDKNSLFLIAELELYEKEEAVVEQIYPDLENERGLSKEVKEGIERELIKSGIPDAMHNTKEGYFYFLLHVDKDNKNQEQHNGANSSKELLYGVSFFKQLPVTAAIKEKFPNISRPHIQKAVCIVSKAPVFGSLVSNLETFAKEYLAKSNTGEQQPLNELYEQMEAHIKDIPIDAQELLANVSDKRLLYFLKENVIPIWKAILLERRILVYSEHPSACSTFIHSLLSLFPCANNFRYSSQATAFSENHFTEYGFPLKIYNDKCLLLPYLGLQHVDEVSAAKGFIGGTSNFLIKTLNKMDWHILIDLDTGKIQWKNDAIKKSLMPTSTEKNLITSISKSLDSKLLKENNTSWKKLLEIIIVPKNVDQTVEGSEEWIRQKFYGYFKDLLTEIEFFKYSVSEQTLGHIVEQYNTAHTPAEQEAPNSNSNPQVDPNDSQESEEESKESIEVEKPKEDIDKKKEAQENLDEHLGLMKASVNLIKEYGVDWLLEWSKTDNFREWIRKYRKTIRERSEHNIHAANYLWFYVNGDIYLGGLSHSKRHGYGQFLEREAKMFYKGDWEHGKKSGPGMLSSIGGTELVYDGHFKDDKKQGFGRLIKGKERYVGKFVNDLYEGNGILIDKDQNVYEGDFKAGQKWGMGKLKFAGGEVYIGQFAEGQLHGQGQYVSPNGDIYSGAFNSDAMTGHGILQMTSGDIYEGGFKEAEFSGHGTLKKSDGFIVEGKFEHGVLVNNQDGMIIYPDGSKYKGRISNYKANGEGVLLNQGEEGATVVKGKFENGQLVEKIKEEYYVGKDVLKERKETMEANEAKDYENLALYF